MEGYLCDNLFVGDMTSMFRRKLLASLCCLTAGCVDRVLPSESSADPAEPETKTDWPMTGYDSRGSSAVSQQFNMDGISSGWSRSIGSDVFAGVTVGENDVVVSGDNTFISIDRSDAESISYDTPPGNVGGSAVVLNDLIVVPRDPIGSGVTGDSDLESPLLYAFDTTDGEVAWRAKLQGDRVFSAIKADKFIALTDKGLRTVASDGTKEWTYLFEEQQDDWNELLVRLRPAFDGEAIFTPCPDGVCRITPGRDQPDWTRTVADIRYGPVVTDDGTIVVSSRSKTVVIDEDTGESVWTLDEGALYPPATIESTLVGQFGGYLRAVNTNTGERLWRHDLDEIAHAPAIVGSAAVVADTSQTLRVLDIDSGDELATLETDGFFESFVPTTTGIFAVLQQGENYELKHFQW